MKRHSVSPIRSNNVTFQKMINKDSILKHKLQKKSKQPTYSVDTDTTTIMISS